MKNNKEKVFLFLGFVICVGKIVFGDDLILFDFKKGKVNLILIVEDVLNNIKKFFKDKLIFRNILYLFFLIKEEIGFVIGKFLRVVVGIKDENFFKKIIELIEI